MRAAPSLRTGTTPSFAGLRHNRLFLFFRPEVQKHTLVVFRPFSSSSTPLFCYSNASASSFPSAATTKSHSRTPFDAPQQLKYLGDPITKKPLSYDPERNELVCKDTGMAYPINPDNGIPDLRPASARKLD
ncbi:hypothetical protein QOT17_010151 [Balamuthia mandrillaris]